MRHRGGVDDAVAGGDGVHVGKIAKGGAHQIALREHDALGPAGGAARIEEPGHVVAVALGQSERLSADEAGIVPARHLDDPLESRRPRPERLDGGGQLRGCQADARAAVLEDIGDLARMQLGVDRYGDEPRVPAGVHRLDILGQVLHHESDAVIQAEAELLGEPAREPRNAERQSAIVEEHLFAERHGRLSGCLQGALDQHLGEVHGSSGLSAPARRQGPQKPVSRGDPVTISQAMQGQEGGV